MQTERAIREDRRGTGTTITTLFKCLIVCMNLYPNPWDLINNGQRYRQVMLSSKSRADQFKKEPVTPFWSTPGRGKRILGQWVT